MSISPKNKNERGFNQYMGDAFTYQGQMNAMANSIDLMLNVILEGEGVRTRPREMLSGRIRRFRQHEAILAAKYTGDFGVLVKKLRKFNTNWNIIKHGMIVGGQEDITIHKDGKFHTFGLKRRDEIGHEFTGIMQALIEISKGKQIFSASS